MQSDQWFARTLYPSNGLAKSNDFWEDMDDYTNKYIEVLKDNENEQVEKIHDDHTEPGVPKFVGKYTHGMQEHENELVNDTRNLRNQEKKEAKRRQGSDNPDSVLRRVDQYAKKEMAVIDRNEKKQKNRIRQDHNSKGTPSSIHDQNHEYDDHTENMKDDIGDVQRQEREDIRRKLGKSRNALTLMDVYNNTHWLEAFAEKQEMQKGVRPTAEYIYGDPRRYEIKDPYLQPTVADPTLSEKHTSDRFEAEERAKLAEQENQELRAGQMTSALAFKTSNKISDERWDELQSAIKNISTIAEKRAAFEKIGGKHHSGYLSQALDRHATRLGATSNDSSASETTTKSLANMSLVDIYHSKNSTADIDALIKRLIIPGDGSENPEKIAQDELRRQGVFQINSTKEGVPVLYDTKPETSPSSDRPPTKFRKPKATSTATMIPLSEAVGKPGGSAMSADMKSRLAEIKRRATAEDAAEPRTPSRPPSTDTDGSEELTDDELGRMFEEQHDAESQVEPAPSRPFSGDDIKTPEELTSADLRRILNSLQTTPRGIRRKKSLSTAQLENYLSKAQSVLSTTKPRVSEGDVDREGYLLPSVEARTASADRRRQAESRMARRSTIKPNNIREVNRRQIDLNTSRPGSRANIAQGRQTKLAEQASGMKTKGDLPIPVPPDPYRAGEGTGTQRRDVRQRADERMRGHEAAESEHEERIYRQAEARRRERIAEGIPDEDLDWDGSYYDD